MVSLLERQFWQWVSAHASMASQWKSSYFVLYLVLALQNKSFKIIADLDRNIEYFKNRLTVSSNNTCSVTAVDPQNKKKEE